MIEEPRMFEVPPSPWEIENDPTREIEARQLANRLEEEDDD